VKTFYKEQKNKNLVTMIPLVFKRVWEIMRESGLEKSWKKQRKKLTKIVDNNINKDLEYMMVMMERMMTRKISIVRV